MVVLGGNGSISIGQILNGTYKNTYANYDIADINKDNADDASIEKILTASERNMDYTYEVEQKGKYIVGIMNSNQQGAAGTISTSAKEILSKSMNITLTYTRFSTIKIIEANPGDKIEIKGYNSYYYVNAFIAKLNSIDVKEVYEYGISSDDIIERTYKAGKQGEKVLAIAFANGDNRKRTASLYFSSGKSISTLSDNCDYIDYIQLDKDATVKTSAYGYDWGGGSVYILK